VQVATAGCQRLPVRSHPTSARLPDHGWQPFPAAAPQQTVHLEGGSRAALRRRTSGYWWMRSSVWAGNVPWQPRKPTVSWAASRAAWPAGRERGFCPLTPLSSDPTWSP